MCDDSQQAGQGRLWKAFWGLLLSQNQRGKAVAGGIVKTFGQGQRN